MKSRLKTTTALIASLSLAIPAPGIAQEEALICPDGSALPCAEGVEPIPAPAQEPAEAEAEEPAVEEAPAEEVVEEPAVEEAPAEEVVEEPAVEEAPAEEVVEEPAVEEAPAEEVVEEPAVEEAPVEEAVEEPAEEAPAEEEAIVEEPAAEEPVAEEAPVEEAPAEEAPAASDVEEDGVTSEDDLAKALAEQSGEQAPAEAEAVDEPVAEETLVEEPEAQESATEETATEEPATEETATEGEEALTTEDDLAKALAGETGEAAPVEVPELPVQPEAASGEAPVAAAAEVTVEPTEEVTSTEVEVSEEVVTEETARSSAEDFSNRVNEAPALAAAPRANDDDDDGLSNGQKALLVGLGILAVGAIISNNRKVELNSGDRLVVQRPDGSYQVIKDDNALLRQPGSRVRTETFDDGSTRTTVTRTDGSRIVTIRDAEYRVLRRVHVSPEGYQTLLIDDTRNYDPVDVTRLPAPRPVYLSAEQSDDELRAALRSDGGYGRSFSLAQVRDIREVRELVPVIDLNAITFETGSAAIKPDQAKSLSRLGKLIRSYVVENPAEVFLIEGHTDAVGSAASNLALSDRRAESVALALTEYFGVPPENMVVQGYGEAYLKVPSQGDERANRRAAVRRITDLLNDA